MRRRIIAAVTLVTLGSTPVVWADRVMPVDSEQAIHEPAVTPEQVESGVTTQTEEVAAAKALERAVEEVQRTPPALEQPGVDKEEKKEEPPKKPEEVLKETVRRRLEMDLELLKKEDEALKELEEAHKETIRLIDKSSDKYTIPNQLARLEAEYGRDMAVLEREAVGLKIKAVRIYLKLNEIGGVRNDTKGVLAVELVKILADLRKVGREKIKREKGYIGERIKLLERQMVGGTAVEKNRIRVEIAKLRVRGAELEKQLSDYGE